MVEYKRRPKRTKAENRPHQPARPESSLNEATQESGEAIYFGKHVVMGLLKEQRQVNKLFLQKGISGPQIKTILDLAKEAKWLVQEVPKAKLDELTDGENHQGLVVTMPAFAYSELADCFALAKTKEQDPFFLVLDGIEDPHNLGSILRTADAVGVHGVIIPKRRSVSLTGVVAKTSAGAIEHVPVVRVTNLAQTIEQLKSAGVWVFATAMEGQDMRQWNSQGPIALVIGNEGQGVSPLVQSVSDGTVTIPMQGHVQSLNASVAASVLMYEVARKRML
ncbi:23S rRNA (guanosine(2251)-2'-O)-methyltransferase RlmB [Vaginisenegalia massiliensis]|uniref:23S rRNA (guanosine(2251)-2'-O)-methyltransferase RlmB n=1 Tax=Vaginisenegalia massiliensis TaxID=2058294 RepID=UPI000F521EAF|nr:23S rRNA (guanosine(2251)-2'-O)-methyltransferase RlmB [Vaginisenegalia massiliensis]